MGRSPCCSKEGLNRGAWTALEDRILAAYIKTHGEGKWRNLPKRAGLKRCGKSCRLRWLNYLRPDIKRGNISHDEEELIIRLHKLLGNRWSLIAGRLPGRTDNEIKNYWNTTLGKKVKVGVGVGVGAGAADSSPPESPESPTAVKKNKSNSKAKRPATVTDRNPKSSASSQPRLETSPPPPAAIRTKALRCTTVVAPATDSSSLFINKPTTIENQSHSNSIISKPQSEMQYCTTTQHLKYSHGIQVQVVQEEEMEEEEEEEEEEEPFKFDCHDFEVHNYDDTLFKDWTPCEFLHHDNATIDLGYLASFLDSEDWP